MEPLSMKILKALYQELVTRRFNTVVIGNLEESGSFSAFNANFKERGIVISATTLTDEASVKITIHNEHDGLLKREANAIMRRFIDRFDLDPHYAVYMFLQNESSELENIATTANILTRAYSYAVTTE